MICFALDARPRPRDARALVSELDTSQLVSAAAGGDRAAFAQLHRRYAPLVHSILLARAPVGEADDLVQDVFLQAWRRLGTLRDAGAFGPWISRIARNRAIDYFRRHKPTVALPEEIAQTAPPRAEAREALDAIRSLPEAYRETLLMRLVEGLTGPEIAARTGLKPGSVRVNLHRGMQLLRDALGLHALGSPDRPKSTS
jgi:RNA polymerase sigma-70 factor (ECF subfamily)